MKQLWQNLRTRLSPKRQPEFVDELSLDEFGRVNFAPNAGWHVRNIGAFVWQGLGRGRKVLVPGTASIVLLSLLFAGFGSSASAVQMYANSCLGGWDSPRAASGEPEVAKGDEFTEDNSAVLDNSSATLFCGSFRGDIPEDTLPEAVMVNIAWSFVGELAEDTRDVLDRDEPIIIIDGSDDEEAAVETETETEEESTEEVLDVEVTDEDEALLDEAGDSDEETAEEVELAEEEPEDTEKVESVQEIEPEPEPEEQPEEAEEEIVEEIEEPVEEAPAESEATGWLQRLLVPVAWAQEAIEEVSEDPAEEEKPEVNEETETAEELAPEPEPEPAEEEQVEVEESTEGVVEDVSDKEELSDTDAGDLEVESEDTETEELESEIDSDESEGEAEESETEEVEELEDSESNNEESKEKADKHEEVEVDTTEELPSDALARVEYTLDGETWSELALVSAGGWQDFSRRLPLPELATWDDLEDLQIAVSPVATVDAPPVIYIDAIWLTVQYYDIFTDQVELANPDNYRDSDIVEVELTEFLVETEASFGSSERPTIEIDLGSLDTFIETGSLPSELTAQVLEAEQEPVEEGTIEESTNAEISEDPEVATDEPIEIEEEGSVEVTEEEATEELTESELVTDGESTAPEEAVAETHNETEVESEEMHDEGAASEGSLSEQSSESEPDDEETSSEATLNEE